MSRSSRVAVRITFLAALCVVAPAASAGDPAGTPTRKLVAKGDVLPDSPVEPVVFSVHERQLLSGGELVEELGWAYDTDASGLLASALYIDGLDSAVTLGDTVVLREDDTLAVPGLEPGATWKTLGAVAFDGAGHLVVLVTPPIDPYLQVHVAEPAGPAGASASNGLAMHVE